MYVQCKVYVQLWKRLKAYNRVIYVQNCPETSKKNIFEKPALMEPNFESKEMLGVHHSDTNSSHYTEPEDCAAEILHVWLLGGRAVSVCPWRFKISLFTANCSTFLKSANSWGLADEFFYICFMLEFFLNPLAYLSMSSWLHTSQCLVSHTGWSKSHKILGRMSLGFGIKQATSELSSTSWESVTLEDDSKWFWNMCWVGFVCLFVL